MKTTILNNKLVLSLNKASSDVSQLGGAINLLQNIGIPKMKSEKQCLDWLNNLTDSERESLFISLSTIKRMICNLNKCIDGCFFIENYFETLAKAEVLKQNPTLLDGFYQDKNGNVVTFKYIPGDDVTSVDYDKLKSVFKYTLDVPDPIAGKFWKVSGNKSAVLKNINDPRVASCVVVTPGADQLVLNFDGDSDDK